MGGEEMGQEEGQEEGRWKREGGLKRKPHRPQSREHFSKEE